MNSRIVFQTSLLVGAVLLLPPVALAADADDFSRPLALLGTVKDWRGVTFGPTQFEQVRKTAAENWLDVISDSPQTWIRAANGALWTLTPTAELLPAEFLSNRGQKPEDHGRYSGVAEPMMCGGHAMTGVVMHRIPPAAEQWRPEPGLATTQNREVVRERQALVDQAWAKIGFARKDFDCAMAWLEREALRQGLGGPRTPENGDEQARAPGGGADFAWINAASAYLKALDAHSDLVSAAFWTRVNQPVTAAATADVGLHLAPAGKDRILVDDVTRNSPAWQADVRVGDQLLTLDKEPTTGKSAPELEKALGGKEGTKVVLGLMRDKRTRHLTLTRRVEMTPDAEAWRIAARGDQRMNQVGLLHLTEFVDKTGLRTWAAMEQAMRSDKSPIQGWILDLRDNGGGVLDEAVAVADLFLRQGSIVRVKRRNQEDIVAPAKKDEFDVLQPLVVLVNGGCASACEALTAALRENGRALIVGDQTYGKASMQKLIRPFSSPYFVKVTIARYYGPAGGCLQAVGVTPDVLTTRELGGAQAAGMREADLSQHLAADNCSTTVNPLANKMLLACVAQARQQRHQAATELFPRQKADEQVATAIDALRCLAAP